MSRRIEIDGFLAYRATFPVAVGDLVELPPNPYKQNEIWQGEVTAIMHDYDGPLKDALRNLGPKQPPLFNDHALARNTDPTTSHGAEAELRKREGGPSEIRPNTHRHRALEAIVKHGPIIWEEVRFWTGIEGVWKRVSDLKTQGMIEPTGYTNHSRSGGRPCELLQATPKGRTTYMRLGPTKGER